MRVNFRGNLLEPWGSTWILSQKREFETKRNEWFCIKIQKAVFPAVSVSQRRVSALLLLVGALETGSRHYEPLWMAGGDTLVLSQNHTRVGGKAEAGQVVSREPHVGRAQADKFNSSGPKYLI